MGHESHDDTYLRRAVNPLIRTKLDINQAGKPSSWLTSDLFVSVFLFILFGFPSLLLIYSSMGFAEPPEMTIPSMSQEVRPGDFIFIPLYFAFGVIWGLFGLTCFYFLVWKK